MKKLFLSALLTLCVIAVFAQVHVRGYTRSNGTYVQPHMRSSPNSSPYDNYSFPGNKNPYTGKVATGNPETYLKRYNSTSSSTTTAITPSYNNTSVSTPQVNSAGGLYSTPSSYNNMPTDAEVAKNNREWEENSRRVTTQSQLDKSTTSNHSLDYIVNANKKIHLKDKNGSYTGEYLRLTDEDETVKQYTLYSASDFPTGTLKVYSNGERLLFDNFGRLLKHTKHKK